MKKRHTNTLVLRKPHYLVLRITLVLRKPHYSSGPLWSSLRRPPNEIATMKLKVPSYITPDLLRGLSGITSIEFAQSFAAVAVITHLRSSLCFVSYRDLWHLNFSRPCGFRVQLLTRSIGLLNAFVRFFIESVVQAPVSCTFMERGPGRKSFGSGFLILLLAVAASGGAAYYWYFENEEKKGGHEADFLLKTVTAPTSISKVPEQAVSQEKDPISQRTQHGTIEKMLKTSLQSAIEKVHSATEAKYRTVDVINEHTRVMKRTVDEGEKGDWTQVTSALQKVEKAANNDAMEENDARNYLDSVRKIIEQGEAAEPTRSNPLLQNARETIHKLDRQLDEMNLIIKKTRDEGRILSEYKDLIDKSRKQFASELKSVLPNVDIHAQDSKLNEEELNALIAHAHLKVDQLRKQLAEQQVREKQNIACALEEQKKSQSKLNEEEVNLKVQALREEIQLEAEKMLSTQRQLWEIELEEKLQRAAAAHSDHIEEVVRVQRSLFEIEEKQKIEGAIIEERSQLSKELAAAQGKLEGIETALKSRTSQDIENRRAKQIWILSHNLIDSVIHGRRGGTDDDARRKPLAAELQMIREADSNDEFVACLVNALPDETIYNGVYTEEDLKARFSKLYKICRRVAKMDENNVGVFQYGLSCLQNAMSFDPPGKFSKMAKFDPMTLDSYEILSRAKSFVAEGDLNSAVRILQLLTGPARFIARDWINDVRTHLEARFVAELLVAHAAVNNYSSVY
ncbi:mitofilin [Loa loa]|uniref:MICOS complex subunit MIC60 n=1 Tax=Loa loa TaxID=7209 RepID=A0A1S0UA80_LOALO|nr:mitofilin [Loa loa]EFO27622.1 mitofilin [Loa loa]